jgi:hypothetical protein
MRSRTLVGLVSTADDDTVEARLAALQAAPKNFALRERAALALTREDRHDDAIKLLREGLIVFNAHSKAPLPCMCKKCLKPGATTAEASGVVFQRDFAVAHGRVLFYWVPDELVSERTRVRNSVRDALKIRIGALAAAAKKKKKRVPQFNPETGDRIA